MNNNFVFFGTPDVAVTTLDALSGAGYTPRLIVTSPDRPSGRGMRMTPSPVKTWAIEHNIETLQPEKIDPETILKLSSLDPELFIVIAYGKILPEELINIPSRGTINIHYSLLPRWRGASPIEAAILAGDEETGISIQKMVYKLDAGPIIAEQPVIIDPNETAPELRARLGTLGADLLASKMETILSGAYATIDQDETRATKCGKFKKESGLVDPTNDDPEILYRKYRAYKEWPRIYFFKEGKRFIISRAKFIDGRFIIERVIPEGEKETYWN